MTHWWQKIIPIVLTIVLTLAQVLPVAAQAISLPYMPTPGSMVGVSQDYKPLLMKGIKLFADDPVRMDFVFSEGEQDLTSLDEEAEMQRAINYFMAALTVPEVDLWVNLSPYEENRIIPNALGKTEMGRDLLMQDYLLKQLTSSLVYPDTESGKAFWDKIYSEAAKEIDIQEVPGNSFHKVWIVPEVAEVHVNGDRAFVADSYLKVMLEDDYALEEYAVVNGVDSGTQANAGTAVMRETIIPIIEKEINEGKHFAQLRQIYHAVILASWYKTNLRQSILNKVAADQNKVGGIDHQDEQIIEEVYQQYLQAFDLGAFDLTKEEFNAETMEIEQRRYFSGGAKLGVNPKSKQVATITALQVFGNEAAVVVQTGTDLDGMMSGDDDGGDEDGDVEEDDDRYEQYYDSETPVIPSEVTSREGFSKDLGIRPERAGSGKASTMRLRSSEGSRKVQLHIEEGDSPVQPQFKTIDFQKIAELFMTAKDADSRADMEQLYLELMSVFYRILKQDMKDAQLIAALANKYPNQLGPATTNHPEIYSRDQLNSQVFELLPVESQILVLRSSGEEVNDDKEELLRTAKVDRAKRLIDRDIEASKEFQKIAELFMAAKDAESRADMEQLYLGLMSVFYRILKQDMKDWQLIAALANKYPNQLGSATTIHPRIFSMDELKREVFELLPVESQILVLRSSGEEVNDDKEESLRTAKVDRVKRLIGGDIEASRGKFLSSKFLTTFLRWVGLATVVMALNSEGTHFENEITSIQETTLTSIDKAITSDPEVMVLFDHASEGKIEDGRLSPAKSWAFTLVYQKYLLEKLGQHRFRTFDRDLFAGDPIPIPEVREIVSMNEPDVLADQWMRIFAEEESLRKELELLKRNKLKLEEISSTAKRIKRVFWKTLTAFTVGFVAMQLYGLNLVNDMRQDQYPPALMPSKLLSSKLPPLKAPWQMQIESGIISRHFIFELELNKVPEIQPNIMLGWTVAETVADGRNVGSDWIDSASIRGALDYSEEDTEAILFPVKSGHSVSGILRALLGSVANNQREIVRAANRLNSKGDIYPGDELNLLGVPAVLINVHRGKIPARVIEEMLVSDYSVELTEEQFDSFLTRVNYLNADTDLGEPVTSARELIIPVFDIEVDSSMLSAARRETAEVIFLKPDIDTLIRLLKTTKDIFDQPRLLEMAYLELFGNDFYTDSYQPFLINNDPRKLALLQALAEVLEKNKIAILQQNTSSLISRRLNALAEEGLFYNQSLKSESYKIANEHTRQKIFAQLPIEVKVSLAQRDAEKKETSFREALLRKKFQKFFDQEARSLIRNRLMDELDSVSWWDPITKFSFFIEMSNTPALSLLMVFPFFSTFATTYLLPYFFTKDIGFSDNELLILFTFLVSIVPLRFLDRDFFLKLTSIKETAKMMAQIYLFTFILFGSFLVVLDLLEYEENEETGTEQIDGANNSIDNQMSAEVDATPGGIDLTRVREDVLSTNIDAALQVDVKVEPAVLNIENIRPQILNVITVPASQTHLLLGLDISPQQRQTDNNVTLALQQLGWIKDV